MTNEPRAAKGLWERLANMPEDRRQTFMRSRKTADVIHEPDLSAEDRQALARFREAFRRRWYDGEDLA